MLCNSSVLSLSHTHTLLGSGEWDFYVFQGDGADTTRDTGAAPMSSSQEDRSSDSQQEPINRASELDLYLHQELLMRYGLHIDDFSTSPPFPPPRPPRATLDTTTATSPEEEKKPTFEVIPFVKKTTVTLNFARKTLEEFMDR